MVVECGWAINSPYELVLEQLAFDSRTWLRGKCQAKWGNVPCSNKSYWLNRGSLIYLGDFVSERGDWTKKCWDHWGHIEKLNGGDEVEHLFSSISLTGKYHRPDFSWNQRSGWKRMHRVNQRRTFLPFTGVPDGLLTCERSKIWF